MTERGIHIEHPATPGESLCGYTMGRGCRVAQEGQSVTCEACRAVVRFCRAVRIGILRAGKNGECLVETRERYQRAKRQTAQHANLSIRPKSNKKYCSETLDYG